MKINFAHLRERAASGGWINFAVFDARSTAGTESDNSDLLAQLTQKVCANGLRVDQSALAFAKNGKIHFFGSKNLVKYLSNGWIPHWTHTIDV